MLGVLPPTPAEPQQPRPEPSLTCLQHPVALGCASCQQRLQAPHAHALTAIPNTSFLLLAAALHQLQRAGQKATQKATLAAG
jgi:hypothetical protein